MELSKAQLIAENLVREMRPGCERIAIAGSVRRGKPVVKDLEIVAVPKVVTVNDLFGNPMDHYSALDTELHRCGLAACQVKGGEKYRQYALPEGINLDLFLTTLDQWGWIFTLRTGHKEFGHWLVTPRRYGGALPAYIKSANGWLCNKNGPIRTPTEKDVFRLLGVEWIEPQYRSEEYREMWRLC